MWVLIKDLFYAFSSHITDILQAVAAVVLGQGEADVPVPLPAAADLSEPQGHAGHEERQATQHHRHGKNQDQGEGGRQVEVVPGGFEGAAPAEEECVEGGHAQGTVTQSGLQEVEEGCRINTSSLFLYNLDHSFIAVAIIPINSNDLFTNFTCHDYKNTYNMTCIV